MKASIAFFCSIFSITGSLIYLFLRTGFHKDYLSVNKVLGLSLLLLALPIFINEIVLSKSPSKWHRNYSFLLFVLLLVTSLLGYASREFQFTALSFMSLLGFPFFIWLSIQAFKSQGILKIIAITIFGLLFSTFITSLIFSNHIKPLFFEGTFSWSYLWKIDTLYHISAAQMFNTYGIFSTGLDGVEYLPYHYGSHFLYVGLSNFLNITIPEAYILIPVVITSPLFFFVFFHLIYQVKKLVGVQEDVNYFFVIILLMAFVGYFKNTFFPSSGTLPEYAGMLLGSPILFLSDSYTISLIFLTIMLSLILHYVQEIREHQRGNLSTRLFLWIALPLLFFCAGFSKISILYIAFSIICFLFLRLKLYKNKDYVVSLIVMSIGFTIIYFLVRDEKYGDGGVSLFYHFKEAKQNIFLFLLLHFSWVWALVLLFILSKIGSKNLRQIDEKRMLVEVILAITAASLVPALLIKVKGGQLYYFTEISSWYAAAVILAYQPLFKFDRLNFLDEVELLKKGLIFIILFYFLNVFYSNFQVYKNQMLRLNYTTRYSMLIGPKSLVVPEKFVPKLLFDFDNEKLKAIQAPLDSKFFDSTRVSPPKDFITKLSELNRISLAEKSQSVVYVNFETLEFDLPVKCFERPFLIPALSGIASIHGGITEACLNENPWFSGYGYEYYDTVKPDGTNLSELKSKATQKGFLWLYYFDPKKNDFIKIKC